MSRQAVAARSSRAAAMALERAMIDAVDEVGRVAAREGIDCHYAKGGSVRLATLPAHVRRLHAELDEARAWGLGDDDLRWLDRDEAAAVVAASGVLGATFTPHCAAIHPARLVRGLAGAVERLGVPVCEGTTVTELEPGFVDTDHGRVRAEIVVRATEGYTPTISAHRRELVPLSSLMIATEPLPPEVWDEIGLRRRETFTDGRHLLVYGQRTADDRLAFGGRGAPYHFASTVREAHGRDDRIHGALERTLTELFPVLTGATITHRWGGPLGVARDWTASVGLDRTTGLAWAGGYVGDGVAASNLAGRTLAHLITGVESELTRLPWVGHRSRLWEPEPLRWLGVTAALRLPAIADRRERAGRSARVQEWLLDRLRGR